MTPFAFTPLGRPVLMPPRRTFARSATSVAVGAARIALWCADAITLSVSKKAVDRSRHTALRPPTIGLHRARLSRGEMNRDFGADGRLALLLRAPQGRTRNGMAVKQWHAGRDVR